MERTTEEIEMELDAIATPLGTGPSTSPLENPAVKPITEELVVQPHPGEPGVDADGSTCPRENPPLDEHCYP